MPFARWLPMVLGFAGMLVVVLPGGAVFGAAAMLPIPSSTAWATAVACARKLGASDSAATTMLYPVVAGAVVLALLLQPGASLPALAPRALPLLAMAVAWCSRGSQQAAHLHKTQNGVPAAAGAPQQRESAHDAKIRPMSAV